MSMIVCNVILVLTVIIEVTSAASTVTVCETKFQKVVYNCIVPTPVPATTTQAPQATQTTTQGQATTQSQTTVVTTLPASTTLSPSTNQITICEYKSHIFTCPSGKVMFITHVLWGRLPPAPDALCNPYETNVTDAHCRGGPAAKKYVDTTCNGKYSCVVKNDWMIMGPDPCTGVPKYLQVNYQCVIPTTTAASTTSPMSITTLQRTPTTTKKTTTPTTFAPTTATPTPITTTKSTTTPKTTPTNFGTNLAPVYTLAWACLSCNMIIIVYIISV